MNHCLKISGIIFFAFLAGASTTFAQPRWHYKVDQYGVRRAFIDQKSTVLGSTCSTRLEFHATQDGPNSTGALGLDFTVSPTTSIKGFDFDYFDGPGAPVGDHELMRITVTKGGKRFVHAVTLVGYFSADVADGFVFETNNLTDNKQGQVRKVLDQMLQNAISIEVAVTDGENHKRVLSATFPLTGSKLVFEALLKGI